MSGVVIRYPQRSNRKVYVGVGAAFAALGVALIVVILVAGGGWPGYAKVALIVSGVFCTLVGAVTIVVNFASSAARFAGKPYFGANDAGVVLGPAFTLPWSEVAELRSTWESAEPSRPSAALAGGGHLANAMISSALAGRRTLVVTIRVRDWQQAHRRAAAVDRTAAAFFSDETAPAIVVRFHPMMWGREVNELDHYLGRCGALR